MRTKKLTIKRSKWLRGGCGTPHGNDRSCLYRPEDGKKCCLGFLALANGATMGSISSRNFPMDISPTVRHGATAMLALDENENLVDDLVEVNDNRYLRWNLREKKIKTLMKRVGVEVTFVP